MHWGYVAGILVLGVLLFVLYEYLAEGANIDEEASKEAESESPNEHEHVLFEHKREVAEAEQTMIDEGYSEQ
ncbi:hypothetical protein EXS62_01500 [Candidatus Kaiserbacteria bacterium]|nr:hypothetical protein [Candidatus Kaiserbacteria bacterium]